MFLVVLGSIVIWMNKILSEADLCHGHIYYKTAAGVYEIYSIMSVKWTTFKVIKFDFSSIFACNNIANHYGLIYQIFEMALQ